MTTLTTRDTEAGVTLDDVIAVNVRNRRKELGLSQAALAEKLRCSRHRVIELEGGSKKRGRRPAFNWETLVTLCYALNVTLYQLVLPALPDADADSEIDADPKIDVMQTGIILHRNTEETLHGLRREELGLRVFGVSGDVLLEADTLSVFSRYIAEAADESRDRLRKFGDVVVAAAADLIARSPDDWTISLRELLDDYERESTNEEED